MRNIPDSRPDAHKDFKEKNSVLIDYIGVTVEAKEVNWYELNTMSDIRFMRDGSDTYRYLGNYFGAHDRSNCYALFSNPERTEKYCVLLPSLSLN